MSAFVTGSRTTWIRPAIGGAVEVRSFPFGSMLVWMGMIGSVVAVLQLPTCAGSLALFATVTVTGVEVVSFPAESRATAVSTCEPFPPVAVSQLIV